MKRTQQRKVLRILGVGIALLFLAMAIASYVPTYMDYWRIGLGWTLLLLLAVTFFSPIGHSLIGDVTQKKSLFICSRKIIISYLLILVFLFTLLLLLTTNVTTIPTEELFQIVQQNLTGAGYAEWIYPWVPYVFATVLTGGAGYAMHKPKMSGIAAQLFLPRQLSPFYASIVDYMAVFGFYVGMLAVVGVTTITFAQALCGLFGYSLDFHIDLTILGLGFAMIYLPVSSIWKTFRNRLEKSNMSPGATLLWLLIIYSLFILLMYAILHVFLTSFTGYFSSLEKNLPQLELDKQLAELPLMNLLWGFSMISMTVIGAWWANILQGYTVRQAMLLLFAPLALGWIIYQLMYLSNGLNFTTLYTAVAWFWEKPQVYVFSLIPALIIIASLWRKNNLINAIFWVFPNESGRKLSRIRKSIIWGSMFVGYAAAFNLLTGIYFMQNVIQLFAIFFSFGFIVVILGYIRFFIRKTI